VRIITVPRYKTSGLSGDEWRTSVQVEVLRKGRMLLSRGFGDIATAAAALPWLLISRREMGGYEQVDTSDLCMQPGCAEPWEVVYRKKENYCGSGCAPRPVGERWPKYRAFCARHARRGDCGLDDADPNYETVEGQGPDAPGKQSRDESPSAFAGTVLIEDLGPTGAAE
jgi:hypothetical protein